MLTSAAARAALDVQRGVVFKLGLEDSSFPGSGIASDISLSDGDFHVRIQYCVEDLVMCMVEYCCSDSLTHLLHYFRMRGLISYLMMAKSRSYLIPIFAMRHVSSPSLTVWKKW